MCRRDHEKYHGYGHDFFKGFGETKPTLPSIIILILILLQFDGYKFRDAIGNSHLTGLNGIDTGILFIIAIFYLSCRDFCKTDCY